MKKNGNLEALKPLLPCLAGFSLGVGLGAASPLGMKAVGLLLLAYAAIGLLAYVAIRGIDARALARRKRAAQPVIEAALDAVLDRIGRHPWDAMHEIVDTALVASHGDLDVQHLVMKDGDRTYDIEAILCRGKRLCVNLRVRDGEASDEARTSWPAPYEYAKPEPWLTERLEYLRNLMTGGMQDRRTFLETRAQAAAKAHGVDL